jgi:RNA polymerase sigma-70 factor, ECF subfamily
MSVKHCNQELVAVTHSHLGEDSPRLQPVASQDESGAEFDVAGLLSGAREGDGHSIGELLQHYRNYLMLLATTQIERRLKPRVSPSDIVQESMLLAHRHFAQFRGQTERELLAWLRQILVTNLARFVERYMLAAKRDIRREVSIERAGATFEESSSNLSALLLAACQTPSAVVQQREEAVVLADRLAQLPPKYRNILLLRDIQGLSFEDVAAQLNRPLGATRMLWLRAIKKLRAVYRKAEEQDA